jgi:hypothetical protein
MNLRRQLEIELPINFGRNSDPRLTRKLVQPQKVAAMLEAHLNTQLNGGVRGAIQIVCS